MADDCVARAFLAVGQWIYDYQTLLTGAGAVAAAYFAIGATRDQISQAEAHRQRDREARLRAARASLPTTLSLIAEYAAGASKALDNAWPGRRNPPDVSEHQKIEVMAEIPSFPEAALSGLERIVELSEVGPVTERIESILREVQLLYSRTRPLVSVTQIERIWLAELILQALAIYAKTETLFDYARNRRNGLHAADLWERVDAAARKLNVTTRLVHELAARERAAGLQPGVADRDEPD